MKAGQNLWAGALALILIAVAAQVIWVQTRPRPAATRPADEGLDPELKLPPPVYVSPADD